MRTQGGRAQVGCAIRPRRTLPRSGRAPEEYLHSGRGYTREVLARQRRVWLRIARTTKEDMPVEYSQAQGECTRGVPARKAVATPGKSDSHGIIAMVNLRVKCGSRSRLITQKYILIHTSSASYNFYRAPIAYLVVNAQKRLKELLSRK